MASRPGPGAPGGSGGARRPRVPPSPASPPPAAADAPTETHTTAEPGEGEADRRYSLGNIKNSTVILAESGANVTVDSGEGGEHFYQRPLSAWKLLGEQHRGLRRVGVAFMVVGALVTAGALLHGCGGSPSPSSSTGGTGTSGSTQATTDGGNQSGLGQTQTTPAAPPPPSDQPPDFVPQPHQGVVGGSSSDSYTAEYQNASSTAAYDVYVEFREDNGQLARFDSSGAVMCDPQATYTPQFAERTAILCPEVPAGADIDFTPAIWDNPSKGHIHIYFSANRGQGPTNGPDTGDPPQGSPQILVDTVDIDLGLSG